MNTYDHTYEGVWRVVYGEGWTFVPVCVKCGRFVKADKTVKVSEMRGLWNGPNARCRKCGRTEMLFEGCI